MRLSTLKSKGAQPEIQIKVTSDTPPKIEAQSAKEKLRIKQKQRDHQPRQPSTTFTCKKITKTTTNPILNAPSQRSTHLQHQFKNESITTKKPSTSLTKRWPCLGRRYLDQLQWLCCGFRRISHLTATRTCACFAECHLQHLQKLRNNNMCKARSKDHCYWNWITHHRTIPPPSIYLSRWRITALFTRLEPTHGERMHCRVYRQNFQTESYGLPSTCPYRIQISPSHIMARHHTTGAA